MITEVQIHYPGREGQGVGSDDEGNLYFVPGALPGDRVRVEFSDRKRYRNARLVEVVEPSPHRRPSPCVHSAECGGCDWLEWEYSAQLEGKQTHLEHVLSRADWKPDQMLAPLGAANPLGYRTRVQLHRGASGYGFHRRQSHDVIELEQCPVSHPEIARAIPALEGDSPTVELYLGEDGEVRRSDRRGELPFVQINREQNERLRRLVAERMRGAKKVLELYCGAGNLTSAYAGNVSSVFAFDADAGAIDRAREQFGGEGVIFVADRVDGSLGRKLPKGFREQYDTLLLDPPRSGAGFPLGDLVHDNLKRILYVSCSPISFTKDVQSLKDRFNFESIQIVDMFPQTRHIELLAVFSR